MVEESEGIVPQKELGSTPNDQTLGREPWSRPCGQNAIQPGTERTISEPSYCNSCLLHIELYSYTSAHSIQSAALLLSVYRRLGYAHHHLLLHPTDIFEEH